MADNAYADGLVVWLGRGRTVKKIFYPDLINLLMKRERTPISFVTKSGFGQG